MDKVYIIESVAFEDSVINRSEGNALYQSLLLAECDADYKLVDSKRAFVQAMEFIAEDFYKRKGKWSAMPLIHISAHGNEFGIGLTDEDFFDWADFAVELEKINSRIGYVTHVTEYSNHVSRITLSFSSCKGFNAFKIWDLKNYCPFQSVVGPIDDVDWSDSLTAFITFYHLANFKNKSFKDAVVQMNNSAGLDNIFQLYISPEVGKKKIF